MYEEWFYSKPKKKYLLLSQLLYKNTMMSRVCMTIILHHRFSDSTLSEGVDNFSATSALTIIQAIGLYTCAFSNTLLFP